MKHTISTFDRAHNILFSKANENDDGFITGQPRWIIEAMEEYAKDFKEALAEAVENENVKQFTAKECNLPYHEPRWLENARKILQL